MPGKSMRGDKSKKMGKGKPIQNTEKKRNQYIVPYNMEARQRKKKKKKEKEKRKRKKKKKKGKQLASAPTLCVGSGPAPSGLLCRFGTSHYTDKS